MTLSSGNVKKLQPSYHHFLNFTICDIGEGDSDSRGGFLNIVDICSLGFWNNRENVIIQKATLKKLGCISIQIYLYLGHTQFTPVI